MKLVRLSAGCSINPDDVSDITVTDRGVIEVRMISGPVHVAERRYGEALYEAADRLQREIEGAADGG